ncbi:MAG: M50 family metallopeptidase [Patescibacteria group bacterium]
MKKNPTQTSPNRGGEEGLNPKSRSFAGKPWFLRFAVIIAGPLMNFVLAVAIVSYMFTKGMYLPSGVVRIQTVQKGTPAAIAGLQPKDVVVGIMSGAKKYQVTTTSDMVSKTKELSGMRIQLVVRRSGILKQYFIVPRKNPPEGQGALGIVVSDTELKKYPWYSAPFYGTIESLKMSFQYYQELGKVLVRVVTFQKQQVELAGPVGIAQMAGTAVRQGTDSVLQLLALLSLNLALINVLPFPALDGGHLAWIMYELITGKKVNEQVKSKINVAGFAILMGLIVLITANDIFKLFH